MKLVFPNARRASRNPARPRPIRCHQKPGLLHGWDPRRPEARHQQRGVSVGQFKSGGWTGKWKRPKTITINPVTRRMRIRRLTLRIVACMGCASDCKEALPRLLEALV